MKCYEHFIWRICGKKLPLDSENISIIFIIRCFFMGFGGVEKRREIDIEMLTKRCYDGKHYKAIITFFVAHFEKTFENKLDFVPLAVGKEYNI